MRQARRKGEKHRSSSKRPAKARALRAASSAKHPRGSRTPSRLATARVVERIHRETQEVNGGCLLTTLRRRGYQGLPLEEFRDGVSRRRTALVDSIVSRRGRPRPFDYLVTSGLVK